MSTRVPGYVYRDGKLEKKTKRMSVSERCRQRSSKRIKVGRPGTAEVRVESLEEVLASIGRRPK